MFSRKIKILKSVHIITLFLKFYIFSFTLWICRSFTSVTPSRFIALQEWKVHNNQIFLNEGKVLRKVCIDGLNFHEGQTQDHHIINQIIYPTKRRHIRSMLTSPSSNSQSRKNFLWVWPLGCNGINVIMQLNITTLKCNKNLK